MGAEGVRRSDRISISLVLEAVGTDQEGRTFVESAKTLLVGRHGALILINRKLAPEQKLSLRRKLPDGSQKEEGVRVVGQVGGQPEGWSYGVAFLNHQCEFWGIEFPVSEASEEAVARLLVECTHCQLRELVYLNGRELREFESHRVFARDCKSCKTATLWKQASREGGDKVAVGRAPLEEAREVFIASAGAERQKGRIDTRLTVCIREPSGEEEIAVCENISRDGLCFRSRKRYEQGSNVSVAVPYTAGSANIFVSAQVVHVRALPSAGLYRHGLRYIRPKQSAAVSS